MRSHEAGVLHAEQVNLDALASAVGTPFYCYSTATLARHYQVFAGAFADVPALVCYAMKANSNQAVVRTLARLGAGADVVSGGELKRATRDLDCRLIFEPGRLLVGNAGILVMRVLFVKHGEANNFVVVDAAMNDLIRPTLYDAHHEIWPVAQPAGSAKRVRADVVGPVCESGDFLAVNRDMVEPASGALLAVMSAGAYGAVQAGTYNTRALVPEVLVNGAKWAVVRPRLEVDQLIALDRMPDWL